MYNLKQIRIINKLNTTFDAYYKAVLKTITIYVKLYNNKYLGPVDGYFTYLPIHSQTSIN